MIPAALLACALNVSPVTLEAVIRVESGGNASIVHLNRNGTRDYGLMQVNSSNLPAFGVTPRQAMEPCTNIRIGCAILTANYAGAVRIYGEGQRALQAALSAYNTGDYWRGMSSYVPRYYGQTVPALRVQLVAKREQPASFPTRPVTSYVMARAGGLPEGFNLWIE